MGRNRSISSIIGKATRRPSQPMLTRKKRDNKVPCYCNQCNGKLVLKRTKLFHESAGGSTTTIQDSGNEQLSAELLAHDAGSPPHLEPETHLPPLETEIGLPALGTETTDALRTETSLPPHLETETDSPALGTEPHSLIPRRRPRRYTQVTDDLSDSEAEQYIESSFGEDEDSEHYKRQRTDHDDAAGSDSETNLLISETFEDYSPPNFNWVTQDSEKGNFWVMLFPKKEILF